MHGYSGPPNPRIPLSPFGPCTVSPIFRLLIADKTETFLDESSDTSGGQETKTNLDSASGGSRDSRVGGGGLGRSVGRANLGLGRSWQC
jgi:hypothetical protein